MSDAAATLARAHRTLTAGAASSKKAIAANRRLLREQLQAIEAIEREAESLGLTLTLENDTGQGGHSR